ncbi:MAG: FCD domain-containing protein, partial [Desulfarculaceae bacterium]
MKEDNAAKPLDTVQDIELIRKKISGNYRNLLIFDFATQTGLPASHWLGFKAKDISHLKTGDRLPLKGKVKAAAYNETLTAALHHTISEFMSKKQLGPEDYVFQSRKSSVPLSISSLSRLVKSWLTQAGFGELDGLLSLRKTWDMHFRPESEPGSPGAAETGQLAKTIKYPTRQEIICRELENQIVMGKLKPRQRIIAEKIARQMGVSTIPVREALRHLEAKGFIIKTSQGNSVVRELTKKNLIEIAKLRTRLEITAVRSAAAKQQPKLYDQLQKIHDRHAYYREIGDIDALLQENKKFHFSIYNSADMPMLMELISLLWDRVSPYHYIFHRQTGIPNPKLGSFHHEKMLEGMKEQDPDKVSRWLKKDLEVSAQFLLRIFDHYQQ